VKCQLNRLRALGEKIVDHFQYNCIAKMSLILTLGSSSARISAIKLSILSVFILCIARLWAQPLGCPSSINVALFDPQIRAPEVSIPSRNRTYQDHSSSCVFSSSETFINWSGSIATDIPIMYPKDDTQLRSILVQARACGIKVRPAGTKHSIGGVVHDNAISTRSRTIVVSLAEYTPPAEWDGVIDDTRVRIGAGRTFLDLMALARPHQLLMKTQTAGLIFSVGGVLMNPSAHGSTLESERLCSLLSGLRVMLANGTIVDIRDDPLEVRKWRGSLGLLGMVTAVQIDMRQDTGLAMTSFERSLPHWTFEDFKRVIEPSLEHNNAAEYFVDVFTDTITGLEMNFSHGDMKDASSTSKYYRDLQETNPDLAKTGATIVTLRSRLANWGANLFKSLLPSGWGLPYWRSRVMSKILLQLGVRDAFTYAAETTRDGYYVVPNEAMKFNNLQTFIKCREPSLCLHEQFEALTRTRQILLHESNDFDQLPMFVVEWRLVKIERDTLVLEHLSPGTWISFEIVTLGSPAVDYDVYSKLERAWQGVGEEFGVHHGKAFGFRDTKRFPTGFAELGRIYSADVKDRFRSLMAEYDPEGLFASGAAMEMLA